MNIPSSASLQLGRLGEFLIGPIEAIRVRAFEICFTFAYLYYMLGRFRYFREWLTPAGFHFTENANLHYQITPFRPLEAWAAIGLGIIILVCCLLVLANRFRRISLAALFLSAVYIQHADNVASFSLNKFFIVGFLLLLLSPSLPGNIRSGKVDSSWAFRILQATILIQFFTAGTCKVIHGDWIQHSDVLWGQVQGIYRTEFAAWLLRVLPKGAWAAMQHTALAFELLGPFLIAWRRTRIFGLLWALGFVTVITTTMKQLIFFMLQIVAFLVLFLTASQLCWILRKAEHLFSIARLRQTSHIGGENS